MSDHKPVHKFNTHNIGFEIWDMGACLPSAAELQPGQGIRMQSLELWMNGQASGGHNTDCLLVQASIHRVIQ